MCLYMIPMEAANNLSCCKLAWRPIPRCRQGGARGGVVVRASGEVNGRDHRAGRLVDENMIVLRLRIREMKMLEMQQGPPSDWMGWEKQYYGHYDKDVCEAIGLLQSYLMSVRPSTALGMVALVALSMLISSGVVFYHMLDMAKSFLSSLGYI